MLPLEEKSSPFAKVRFFDFDLALTGYQWVIMAILSGFLLQILWRRWKRADAHLLSKPLALAFSAWIIVMSMGEIFPPAARRDLVRLEQQSNQRARCG